MAYTKIAAALLAMSLLTACGEEECTEDLAKAKTEEMIKLTTDLATANPEKLAALQPKIAEMQSKAAAAGQDMQAACAVLDEMIAELKK